MSIPSDGSPPAILIKPGDPVSPKSGDADPPGNLKTRKHYPSFAEKRKREGDVLNEDLVNLDESNSDMSTDEVLGAPVDLDENLPAAMAPVTVNCVV